MSTEPMCLVDRLRNPQYVIVPGADAALDVAPTLNDMKEAADAIETGARCLAKRLTNESFNQAPALRALVLEMGRVIRALDEDHEHLELWTQDGDYVLDSRWSE